MNMRFFRADAATYAAVLNGINDAWGLPSHGQQTAFASPENAPADNAGVLYLAVWDFFCEYDAVAAVLPGLLANGSVEEIDAATYHAAMPAD